MNILILRPDHIGDMLLTTPLLASMRHGKPGDHITVLTGSWSASVLENNPDHDELVICDYPWLARGGKASWKDFFSVVFKLRRRDFDIVFNLRKAAKASAVAKIIGGKTLYGFDVGKSSWAHDKKIKYRTDLNIADLYLEFVNAVGTEPDHEGLKMVFSDKENDGFLTKTKPDSNYIVFSPGAGYKEKFWFTDKWAETADTLIRDCGIPVVFSGGPADVSMIGEIISQMKGEAECYAGKLTLRESSLLIKHSSLLVSVDSAAVHIASAVKTPVIALYGPTNPVHWGPYPNGCKNVVISKVEKFSLGRGSTNKEGGMELIESADIVEAAAGILNRDMVS